MHRALDAADAFFLSDALRGRTANELAYTRIGIIGCLSVGLSTIAFLPWQRLHWPPFVLTLMVVSGGAGVALPFLLRRRPAIRGLGHFVCAHVSAYALAVLVASGGRATGILPVLPMIPMFALLMRGGRAVVGWGAVAAAIVLVGAALVRADASPLVPGFRELDQLERYPIALICLAAMLGVTVLFERLWNRSARELAERARADLALREVRYRTLLEHASEGILVVDAKGRIDFASPAAERLIGLPAGGAIGLEVASLAGPESLREILPIWREAFAKAGQSVRSELLTPVRRRPDGTHPPRLELTITNHLDHPAVRGIVIHIHDVTDLSRAKANYQNLVEQSLQGISVVVRGQVVYANQAMAGLFGRAREGFVGMPIEESIEYVHPDDRDRIYAALSQPGKGRSEDSEMRFRRDDGRWCWVQLRWSDAIWEGRRARQIVFADVTAQKELEATRMREQERLEARIAERTRELEASQKTLRAQERLAAVGTLAAGVAHQINNPVGAILAAADYALVAADDPDHERVTAGALREIKAQAIRCGKIIRGILQFSRAEPTEKWSGDVGDVLRTAVDATRGLARDRKASVSLEIDRAVGAASVQMSAIELEQVFVNLILNAIQAQPSGARVAVTTRRAAHVVEIRVEDDGPGIPAADRERIFDPFFTTRLKGGGTGLGLSVAHAIVEDHGGRMELVGPGAGRPDVGACFRVTLPLEKPDRGVPTRPA